MDASQSLTLRALVTDAAARPRGRILAGVAVPAAVLAAWLVNLVDWSFGDARAMVAVSVASLVATAAIAAGWASEPEELERWAVRAGVAAFVSALPILLALSSRLE